MWRYDAFSNCSFQNEPTPDADFMPLTVEYQEKYAAGRFPVVF